MTYTFKISLKGTSQPIIWRRVKINANDTFERLHWVIQIAFDWKNYHLHKFYFPLVPNGRFYAEIGEKMRDEDMDFFGIIQYSRAEFPTEGYFDESEILLSDYFEKVKDKITYEYDFGDSWEHQIVLESINEDELLMYPVCLKGKGKTPPEDCGGVWGYYDMLALLEDKKPKGEYKDMVAWLEDCGYNPNWNPEEFDLEGINRILVDFFQSNR